MFHFRATDKEMGVANKGNALLVDDSAGKFYQTCSYSVETELKRKFNANWFYSKVSLFFKIQGSGVAREWAQMGTK